MIEVTDTMIYICDRGKDTIPLVWKDLMMIRRDIGSGVCFIRKDRTRAYCSSLSFPAIVEKIRKEHPDIVDLPDLYMVIPDHSLKMFSGIGDCYLLEKCRLEDDRIERPRVESRRRMSGTWFGTSYLLRNYYFADEDEAIEAMFHILKDTTRDDDGMLMHLSPRIAGRISSGDWPGAWKILRRVARLGGDYAYIVLRSGFLKEKSPEFQEILDMVLEKPTAGAIDDFRMNGDRIYVSKWMPNRPCLTRYTRYGPGYYVTFPDGDDARMARKCIEGVLKSGDRNTMKAFVSSCLMRNGSGDMTKEEVLRVQRRAIGRLIGQGDVTSVGMALSWNQVRRGGSPSRWTEKMIQRAIRISELEMKKGSSIGLPCGMLTIWNTAVMNKDYSYPEPHRSDETVRLMRQIFRMAGEDPNDYLYREICHAIVLDTSMWQYDDMLVPALEKFKETAYGDVISEAARNADYRRRMRNSDLVMDAAFQAMRRCGDARLAVRMSKLLSCIEDDGRRGYLADRLMECGEYKHLVEMQKSYLKNI